VGDRKLIVKPVTGFTHPAKSPAIRAHSLARIPGNWGQSKISLPRIPLTPIPDEILL
jgi:hypothetical protein